ncbi:uncharacterized protein LOC127285784 [Leptopilina boulardi]|uniref:uncharacterized protein LOC127285784 n=1 Tax=Leptopilina boulardi TaxID=63433 RepID=UPI0021F6197D|nr:uncharacterized protein LOC127285784 [Leptopilina boulardi]
MFLYPDEILMNKLAKVTETPFYRYKFGYRGTMNRIYLAFGLKENFGVGHSNELLYLFNYGSLFNNISQHDEHIVNVMIDLWTSFAIVGKPSSNSLKNSNLWQQYINNQSFLQIGNINDNMNPTITFENKFGTTRLDFWKQHFPVDV